MSTPQPAQAALSDAQIMVTYDAEIMRGGSADSVILRTVRAFLAASHQPDAAPVQAAVVYPPDGTVSPFTVINLGSGMVKMGDAVHDGRLPALWFGKNGLGMGVEEAMNRVAGDGETLAVVTFANVEGLDVLLEVVQRIRTVAFPSAPSPAPVQPADATPSQAQAMLKDIEILKEQSEAWFAVVRALVEVMPEWSFLANRGMDSAVLAIKKLAEAVPEAWRVQHLCNAILNDCVVEATKFDARVVLDAYATQPTAQAAPASQVTEVDFLEEWLTLASTPVGLECCGQSSGECCGNGIAMERSAEEVIVEMTARHRELTAALAHKPASQQAGRRDDRLYLNRGEHGRMRHKLHRAKLGRCIYAAI